MKYDYLIVGSGLFGSVFARQMTDAGYKCLVIDKRNHIGGNCYTSNQNGIHIHKYGPHIFHTNNKKIWDYINRYAEFNRFTYRPKVSYKNTLYSFPINLFTLYQIYGVKTPQEAIAKLNEVKIQCNNPQNLEEWILSQIGEDLYRIFVYGYTVKQWGKDPKKLPSSIIKRIPIRFNMNDDYFDDKYQGIPAEGYTSIFNNLLRDVKVDLNTDYLKDRNYFDNMSNKIVYTGAIDEFFNYDEGCLEWRSLRFDTETINDVYDFQGNVAINYTDISVPYTRVIEHKHFNNSNKMQNIPTIITREFPEKWDKTKERFYPINSDENMIVFNKYKERIDERKYIFGGRMADYMYYDMHQVIASSLVRSEKEIKNDR